MDFKTKFNMGDVVHNIWKNYKQEYVPCAFCEGRGTIVGANEESTSCPKCYRRGGSHVNTSLEWMVVGTLTIGQVRIKYTGESEGAGSDVFDNYGPQTEDYKEEYMCLETGIGTGTVHKAENLFSTAEEAQDECDRLNDEELAGKATA